VTTGPLRQRKGLESHIAVVKSQLHSLTFFLGMAVAQPLEKPQAGDAQNSEDVRFTLIELPSLK
jgi:hypothetical protein